MKTKKSKGEIEKIDFPLPIEMSDNGYLIPTFDEVVRDKLNELIEAVNKLTSKK